MNYILLMILSFRVGNVLQSSMSHGWFNNEAFVVHLVCIV